MREDAKEIGAIQDVVRLAEVAALEELQLALVGGGCGEVVLV